MVPTLRRRLPPLLLVFAAAVLAAPARADEPAPIVLSARAGVFLPQGVKEFRPGPDLSVSIGREFFSFLAGDLSAGFAAFSSERWSLPYPGVGWIAEPSRVTARTVPITLTVRGVLPTTGVRPYLLAGAGVLIARMELDPLQPSDTADPMDTVRENHVVTEVHGGLGFAVSLGKRTFAGIEGRYTYARVPAFERNALGLDGIRAHLVLSFTP